MKISLSSQPAFAAAGQGWNPAAAAAILKASGFDAVDFSMCEYGRDTDWLAGDEAYRTMVCDMQAMQAAGIEVTQCHLPYVPGDVVFDDGAAYVTEYLPVYENCLKACGAVGCPVAVIHLYFEADAHRTFAANMSMLRTLLPLLQENNVVLAIENIYAGGSKYLDSHVTTADDILRYVETVNDPHVAVCLDVGHAIITKNNPVDMVYRFGRHLVATHIHSTGRHDNHAIPGGHAKWLDPVNYEALSKALHDIGYTGTYNLEVAYNYVPADAGKPFLMLAAAVARHYAALTGL